MEVYADGLSAGLRGLARREFAVNEYRPRLNGACRRLPEAANIRMRAARYLAYPRQASRCQGDLNHILDHGYAHLLSVLDPGRTVVTVHDIIPILAGRGRIPGARLPRRSWLAEWTARHYRRAARLIAVSEQTKYDLVEHCGCDPARIEVVHGGLDPVFRAFNVDERAGVRKAFGLPGGVFLVLITGVQFYKNQTTSLRVMERLRDRFGAGVRLVRLGRRTAEWSRTLAASPMRGEVIEIGHLARADVPRLYNAVDCLLFPSWYEGFGWPPVEAMACGVPAVTSDAAALPESAGPAALMAAPGDVDGLAAHVARLIEDPDLRAHQIRRGLGHASRFQWAKTAESVQKVYESIAG